MKKTFYLFLCTLLAATTVMAQESSKVNLSLSNNVDKRPLYERLLFEVSAGAAMKQHDHQLMLADMRLGYRFTKNLHAFALFGGDMALHSGDAKTYIKGNHLGVGAGYTIFDGKGSWDFRGSWSHSVGNVDWKQNVWDASIQWAPRTTFSPTFSLGFRHINSQIPGMPNFNVIYGTLGIRF